MFVVVERTAQVMLAKTAAAGLERAAARCVVSVTNARALHTLAQVLPLHLLVQLARPALSVRLISGQVVNQLLLLLLRRLRVLLAPDTRSRVMDAKYALSAKHALDMAQLALPVVVVTALLMWGVVVVVVWGLEHAPHVACVERVLLSTRVF